MLLFLASIGVRHTVAKATADGGGRGDRVVRGGRMVGDAHEANQRDGGWNISSRQQECNQQQVGINLPSGYVEAGRGVVVLVIGAVW